MYMYDIIIGMLIYQYFNFYSKLKEVDIEINICLG